MKHLLCHIWPKREPGAWRRTTEQLRRHWHLFDGRKLIAVATCSQSDSVDDVRAELPADAEIIQFANAPELREVVSFVPLLKMIEHDQDGTLFYCHGKGATHPAGSIPHHWADLLWHVLTDFPELVDCALDDFPIVGCLRRFERFSLADGHGWHFSGSFFWARCRDLFARDYQRIDRTWFGNEAWPGLHFTKEEAACLFLDNAGDLYQGPYWRDGVIPSFRRWQERCRSLGVSTTAHFSPTWLTRPEDHFPIRRGTAGTATTPQGKRSWRPMPIFRRLASVFSTR